MYGAGQLHTSTLRGTSPRWEAISLLNPPIAILELVLKIPAFIFTSITLLSTLIMVVREMQRRSGVRQHVRSVYPS